MIKILVVEDNIVQQKIITTKLTQEGYQFITAGRYDKRVWPWCR